MTRLDSRQSTRLATTGFVALLGVALVPMLGAAQEAPPETPSGPSPLFVLGAALVGAFVGTLLANFLWQWQGANAGGGDRRSQPQERPRQPPQQANPRAGGPRGNQPQSGPGQGGQGTGASGQGAGDSGQQRDDSWG